MREKSQKLDVLLSWSLVDETNDCWQEQLSFVVRYVHGGAIKEEFIGFEEAERLIVESMTLTIREKLCNTAIDIQKCVGRAMTERV